MLGAVQKLGNALEKEGHLRFVTKGYLGGGGGSTVRPSKYQLTTIKNKL